MLQLKAVTKTYPGQQQPALRGIDLTIASGEFVAVLGRSGAGKSTLIRVINRLIEPDAGEVRWNERIVTALNARDLRQVRREIGMVFQHYYLLPRLSVLTNVLVGRLPAMPLWRRMTGFFSKEDRHDALAALREVGLEPFARRRADALSGGQKQRVALARVFLQRPTLLLGDEPISSLDRVTAERVMAYIAKLHREQRVTVILNLHDVGTARAYASRIIGLAGGRIVFDGSPDQLGPDELRAIYPPDDDVLPEPAV